MPLGRISRCVSYLSLYKFFHGSIWDSYVELSAGHARPIARDFACLLNQLDLIEKCKGTKFNPRLDFWKWAHVICVNTAQAAVMQGSTLFPCENRKSGIKSSSTRNLL